jgi:hypothetical protein
MIEHLFTSGTLPLGATAIITVNGITTKTKLTKNSIEISVDTGFTPSPISVGAVSYGLVDNSVSFTSTVLPKVFEIMSITDPTAQSYWKTGLVTAANRESSYDFNAVNTYDLNATGPIVADGHPANCSRGVLQCIPPTFAKYHQLGTSYDIYDAVANTCAAMNYVVQFYGVSRDGHDLAAKVQQFDPTRPPKGY